jgi:hypothetical protein
VRILAAFLLFLPLAAAAQTIGVPEQSDSAGPSQERMREAMERVRDIGNRNRERPVVTNVAAEPATLTRGTELKTEPSTDSATIAWLEQNVNVEAFERRGPWVRVKTANAEGWVRMLSLRYTVGNAKPLFNRAANPNGLTVTEPVRP